MVWAMLVVKLFVSIPERDLSWFQLLESGTLTVFSFQGSVAPTSNKYTIPAIKSARPSEKKSLKLSDSKAFIICTYLKKSIIAAKPYRVRNAAPNFEPSEKTPTDGRN